jgi:hypothetical protein
VGLFTLNITAFWGTISQPTGVARVGWKYCELPFSSKQTKLDSQTDLVFVACSAVNTVLLWYFVIETKGVPLEGGLQSFGGEYLDIRVQK